LFAILRTKPRARDLGVPFVGKTNSMPLQMSKLVGYSTIISGEGKIL
jgi:hypothetical protein